MREIPKNVIIFLFQINFPWLLLIIRALYSRSSRERENCVIRPSEEKRKQKDPAKGMRNIEKTNQLFFVFILPRDIINK